MKRRQFLRYTGVAATIAALPACLAKRDTRLGWLEAAVTVTGFDSKGVSGIGRKALAENPDTEWTAMLPTIDGIAWTGEGLNSDYPQPDIIAKLRETCSMQYAEGNYRIVDGWVLSELETALCAIAYEDSA